MMGAYPPKLLSLNATADISVVHRGLPVDPVDHPANAADQRPDWNQRLRKKQPVPFTLPLDHGGAGQFARAIAEEGGKPSVLWAGPRQKGPVRMTIGMTIDQLQFELSCGLLPSAQLEYGSSDPDPFILDPRIKEEHVWFLSGRSRRVMMERATGSAMLRDAQGDRVKFPMTFSETESILSQLKEPHRFPQL